MEFSDKKAILRPVGFFFVGCCFVVIFVRLGCLGVFCLFLGCVGGFFGWLGFFLLIYSQEFHIGKYVLLNVIIWLLH